jgi:hypothetical protein
MICIGYLLQPWIIERESMNYLSLEIEGLSTWRRNDAAQGVVAQPSKQETEHGPN